MSGNKYVIKKADVIIALVAPGVRSTPHGIQAPPMISVVIKDTTARNTGRTIHISAIPAWTRRFLILSCNKISYVLSKVAWVCACSKSLKTSTSCDQLYRVFHKSGTPVLFLP